MTLASLSRNFGLAPLINKKLVVVPDARLSGKSHEIVERLLAISGGDDLTIDRKYKPAWTGRLPGRFVFLTNEVPELADTSGAIASRFITLQFNESFIGREDLALYDKLQKEMPAILNWAIVGWKRLKKRGFFVQPKGATASAGLLEALASPIKAFLKDCCTLGAGLEVRTKALFAEWCLWCSENGRERPGNEAAFGRDLRAAQPGIQTTQHRSDGTRERYYTGVCLNSWRGASRAGPDDAAAPIDQDVPEEFWRHWD
ncbi:DUF5906 domain-containing protein [Reyranella soli]|uniref:DUF5906 domain-containing protein n=1 Tax=Reyranella soli TaxID=1230389 RepID=UPI0011BF478D|nr:DUF5906 domain-containing protein [Reyranella soli]